MYGNAAAKAYRRVDLESAPKTQILERLYDRFARDIADARVAITARNIEAKAKALSHASQIVLQLKMALDHSVAPEMCRNLESLYNFVLGRLAQANIKLTTKPLDDALVVMSGLGAAFKQAHAKL
jgi:flagellar secretion chaperone FliS